MEILSGIFEGYTTGTPISLIVHNEDQRSRDYGKIKDCYRPGHADYTFDCKYGFRDYRGGGIPESDYDYTCISNNKLYMPNEKYAEIASEYLENCMKSQDSSGGIIECIINGMPVGIGDPVFHKLDARLAQAIMSIGAVKGVEIGDGFQASVSKEAVIMMLSIPKMEKLLRRQITPEVHWVV